jgi:hypothetical protein
MLRLLGILLFFAVVAVPIILAGAIVEAADRGGRAVKALAFLAVLSVGGADFFVGYHMFAGFDGIRLPVAGVAAMVVGSLIGLFGVVGSVASLVRLEGRPLRGQPGWEAEARKDRIKRISELEEELRRSTRDVGRMRWTPSLGQR